MYRCMITGKVSQPGEVLHKVVVEKRDQTYTRKIKNEETGRWEDVVIGKGWEIVREISLSLEGVAFWESWSDVERQVFLEHLKGQ